MSRYGDDYGGESFPGELALWNANADRALKGRRGRQALRDLRDALLALPEGKLIEGALCTVGAEARGEGSTWARIAMDDLTEHQGEGVCAVGALVWHRKVKAGMDPEEAFRSLPTLPDTDSELSDTAGLAVREAGIAYPLAWRLAYRNDEEFGRMTPEERYTAFLAWIDAELGETAGAGS